MYGDFGSATDVAEEAVRAVADAWTGRGPATSLSRLLPALAGCGGPAELLQALSRGLAALPAAAPLVLAEAEAGDPAAQAIVHRAGTSLGQAAALVAGRLDLGQAPFEVVMAGGLFAGRSRLLETTLVEILHRVPRGPPPSTWTASRWWERPLRPSTSAGWPPPPRSATG